MLEKNVEQWMKQSMLQEAAHHNMHFLQHNTMLHECNAHLFESAYLAIPENSKMLSDRQQESIMP